MSNFKSQVELSKHAYEATNGDRTEMVKMVAKLLAEHPELLKESKRNELDAKGPKGYESYAKVKVREYFTRTLKQAPAKAKPEPKSLTEAIVNDLPSNDDGFRADPDANPSGTSFHNVVLNASYAQIAEAFGEAMMSDEYKVSSEWTFTGPNDEVFTIYDWKETNLYDSGLPSVEEFRARSSAEFHVGHKRGADVLGFVDWVNSKLNTSRKLRAV